MDRPMAAGMQTQALRRGGQRAGRVRRCIYHAPVDAPHAVADGLGVRACIGWPRASRQREPPGLARLARGMVSRTALPHHEAHRPQVSPSKQVW